MNFNRDKRPSREELSSSESKLLKSREGKKLFKSKGGKRQWLNKKD